MLSRYESHRENSVLIQKFWQIIPKLYVVNHTVLLLHFQEATGLWLDADALSLSAGADLKERARMHQSEVGPFVSKARALITELGEDFNVEIMIERHCAVMLFSHECTESRKSISAH